MIGTLLGSRLATSSQARAVEAATAGVLAVRGGGEAKYRPDYLLRQVALRGAWEGWPAGTVGVVIEPFEDAALVEISGEFGVTVAELSVPYEELVVVGAD
jgi:hypothetical protein